jgi:hypothetical protein
MLDRQQSWRELALLAACEIEERELRPHVAIQDIDTSRVTDD